MNINFTNLILSSTNTTSLKRVETIQELWSGYGEIIRFALPNSPLKSVVVKHIKTNLDSVHPRGWNTGISHQRKIKSYQIEMEWYKRWAGICPSECKIPKCFASESSDSESIIVLEDLDTAGYKYRKSNITIDEMKVCLAWLAKFHAKFLFIEPEGLWENGTYWHIDTRPDELEALEDLRLKKAAHAIEEKLFNAKYKTFVHGDAKLANFCFSKDRDKVAMVDFQYVGGGCGIKDVVYFIGSCLYENDCEKNESTLLDHYFITLKSAIKAEGKEIEYRLLESEWRDLFPYAWADFHRFLKGWSPGHWKINSYSEKMCRRVLNDIGA